MKKPFIPILLPVLSVLHCTGAQGQEITTMRSLVASGGVDADGSALHVSGSLGQPIIGPITALHYTNLQGFWHTPPHVTASVAVPGDEASPLACVPNPATGAATIQIRVPTSGEVRVTLHDLLGRTITELDRRYHPAGDFSLRLEADRFPQGSYTIRLEHRAGESTLPVLILR